MITLQSRRQKAECPKCSTAPLQKIEKDTVTKRVFDAELNYTTKPQTIYPAHLYCAFCHSDFTFTHKPLMKRG